MNKDDKNVQNNADTKKIITCRMCGQLVRGLKQPLYMFLYCKDFAFAHKRPGPKSTKTRKDINYEKIGWITFFTRKFSEINS